MILAMLESACHRCQYLDTDFFAKIVLRVEGCDYSKGLSCRIFLLLRVPKQALCMRLLAVGVLLQAGTVSWIH